MKRLLRTWLPVLGKRCPIAVKLVLILLYPFPRSYLSVARLAGVLESAQGRVWTIASGPLAGKRLTGLLPDEIGPILTNSMEIECAKAVSKLPLNGATILDIGASFGYYALFFSRLAGRGGTVYCFDPDPNTFVRLMRNLALNDVENVVALPLSASNTTGLARWMPNDAEPWLGKIVGEPSATNHGGLRVVPCTTLDDFCAAANISGAIRLVKIDVEGAECTVLEGMRRILQLSRPTILCEVHSEVLFRQVGAFLVNAGYVWEVVEYKADDRQHLLAFPQGERMLRQDADMVSARV